MVSFHKFCLHLFVLTTIVSHCLMMIGFTFGKFNYPTVSVWEMGPAYGMPSFSPNTIATVGVIIRWSSFILHSIARALGLCVVNVIKTGDRIKHCIWSIYTTLMLSLLILHLIDVAPITELDFLLHCLMFTLAIGLTFTKSNIVSNEDQVVWIDADDYFRFLG